MISFANSTKHMVNQQGGCVIATSSDGFLCSLSVEDEKKYIKHGEQVDRLRKKLAQRKKIKGEICCFCSDPDIGFGNNPSSRYEHVDKKLHIKPTHRCCDDCNRRVIALRFQLSQK